MIAIQLNSKKDVTALKGKFRDACEGQGLRLGKTQKKIEAILTELFECKNYNELVARAASDEETNSLWDSKGRERYIRINVPGSTYGALEVIKKELQSASHIQNVCISVREGNLNKFALSLAFSSYSGMTVIDGSLLTIERTEREGEVLSLLRELKKLGLADKTFYLKKHLSLIHI